MSERLDVLRLAYRHTIGDMPPGKLCELIEAQQTEIERLETENQRLRHKSGSSLPHMGTVGDGGKITWDPPLTRGE